MDFDINNLKEMAKIVEKIISPEERRSMRMTPPDDSQGVLQDVHWSSVQFGSFPGYTFQ